MILQYLVTTVIHMSADGIYGILLNGNRAVRVPHYRRTAAIQLRIYVNRILIVPHYRRVDCILLIFLQFYYKTNKVFHKTTEN